MEEFMNKITGFGCAVILLAEFLSVGNVWAADVPALPPSGFNDSGVQLNRTKKYLEWQQTMQKIADGRKSTGVETGEETGEKKETDSVRFQLKKVTADASDLLTQEEIQAAAAPYIGKEITLQDLYGIVEKINALYSEKGYVTCRAYLAPQTIRQGTVHISLMEGKTGKVDVRGNRTTREDYIRDRLDLKEGETANISHINKKLLRFNATNDVQLRISMKAGEAYGTTDYVITAAEPQQYIFGLFSDNAGSKTSGLYRGGVFWQDKSLTGNRDSLMMTSVFSKGTKSFGAAYSSPINTSGTKLGVNYSTNSVHIIDGPLEPLDVRGHSYAYSFSLTQPLVTSEKVKSEIGLDYGYQNSKTDFMRMPWVDDTVRGASLFFDQINYGRTTIFYQRHAYRFGNYNNNISDTMDRFGKYVMNMLYQRVFSAGQTLIVRAEGQLSSSNYLPSAEQFYIGGMYSVRGYTESLLGGDSGVSGSIEYSLPMSPDKMTSAYFFLDAGRVWGANVWGDESLAGAGFGIKSTIGDHVSLNIGMGFPLINKVNEEEQSHARVHFSLNSQF